MFLLNELWFAQVQEKEYGWTLDRRKLFLSISIIWLSVFISKGCSFFHWLKWMLAVGGTDWSPLPNQYFLVSEKLDVWKAGTSIGRKQVRYSQNRGKQCDMSSSWTVLNITGRTVIFSPQFLAFKIPNFFLEENSGTKTLDREERENFGYSRWSLGMSHFLQKKLEDIWDFTISKIDMEAKQYCISTDTNTI